MHLSSYFKMKAFANYLLEISDNSERTIIDYGSQDVNGSYKDLFDQPNWKYTGIDIVPGKNVDIVLSDPYDWKEIETSSVDVFISGQAFEHIEYIWLTMLEIERILKPLGLVYIIAPSAGHEHRYPVDCWRIYPDGFKSLAKFANLNVINAITEWDPPKFPDGSELWKDSVLAASKPAEPANKNDLDLLRRNLKQHIANITKI
jgi:SAM-dependent methyltransferase